MGPLLPMPRGSGHHLCCRASPRYTATSLRLKKESSHQNRHAPATQLHRYALKRKAHTKIDMPLSVKQLFSTMITNDDFNTNRQQDAGEGFLLILQALVAMESNFINPFRFCKFSWRQKKRCLNCSEVEHSPIIEDNIVQVYPPKTGYFDMNQFVTSRLQEEDVRNSRCGNCRQIGANYSTQFIETQKVMIIQLNFMDESLTKKKSKCIPLQNLDININGQTKKYELHNIIEHIGPNLHSGH